MPAKQRILRRGLWAEATAPAKVLRQEGIQLFEELKEVRQDWPWGQGRESQAESGEVDRQEAPAAPLHPQGSAAPELPRTGAPLAFHSPAVSNPSSHHPVDRPHYSGTSPCPLRGSLTLSALRIHLIL